MSPLRQQPPPVCVFARLSRPGLGDLVQRNIFVRLLRQAHPGAELTLVIGEEVAARFAELLRHHSYATEVLTCPDPGAGESARWRRFLTAVSKRGFGTCVVDADSRGLGARDAHRCGIPVRIGLPTGGPDDRFLTVPIRLPRPLFGRPDLFEHASGLARALGLPAPRPAEVVPPFPFRPEPLPQLRAPRPLVAVHASGARHWNRRWPLARYAELCLRLTRERDATIVLLGDRHDRQEVDQLRRTVTSRQPSARVHTFREPSLNRLANLLAGADLLVGNDSAPAHLAAALRTPSVVVYGPTGTEFLWARIYPTHRGVSRRYDCQRIWNLPEDTEVVPCAHACGYAYAGPEGPYPRCLTDLDVEDVWRAVAGQIDRVPHPADAPASGG